MLKRTKDAKKGGVIKGNSHKEGGVDAVVKDSGKPIEVEGEEIIINKISAQDTEKRHVFNGKRMSNKEILSYINSENGNGVPLMEKGGRVGYTHELNNDNYKIALSLFNYFKDIEPNLKDFVDFEVNKEYVLFNISKENEGLALKLYNKLNDNWNNLSEFNQAISNRMLVIEENSCIIKFTFANNSNMGKGGEINNNLLAPNGKPSNLTPQQYKLVRTDEFKAWFGDWENDKENASKVVDKNGEPLVVWWAVFLLHSCSYQLVYFH
jgi:hypothetical protein